MKQLAWEDVRGEFSFDGSWRDIYVLKTTLADWERMFDALCKSVHDCEYLVDGVVASLPADAASAFSTLRESRPLLSVTFGGVQANCHFFSVDEIEFDIDPREVAGQRQLDALVGFMQLLAESTGKPAILTPENFPQGIILRANPDGAVE